MKHLFTGLFFLLTIALANGQKSTTIQILSQTSDETIVEVKFGDITQESVVTPKGNAFVLHIDKGTPLLKAGAPDVPKVALPLMIPQKGIMRYEVMDVKLDVVPEQIEIAPSKGDLKRKINPNDVPYTYGSEYEKNSTFPATEADLQTPFVWRDARGQTIWLNPAMYNPITKKLILVKSLKFKLTKTEGVGENEVGADHKRTPSRTFTQMYKKFFPNFDERLLTQYRSNTVPETMLVIIKDELVDAIAPLVAWKRQMGIHTTVVTLSQVGDNSPAAIFNYVKDYYDARGINYLLLVADELAMPPLLRPGSIYSCDNCLGYMEGNDHFPEILVGRFHASTPEQLTVMVNRNLEYEKTPLADMDANWCATGMASCSDEGAGIGDDNQADYEHSNEWKAKHLADGYEKYWEFYDGSHANISPTPGSETADKNGNPINPDLVSVMNGRGVSLYNYTGHGWEQGLVSGNFNVDAVAELRNKGRYPILIAVACCAGNFTNGECLGEAIQRAGNLATGEPWGTIGGYFSSDFQSWAPPMEGQDGMNQYLIDGDGTTLVPVMGAMASFGNALMIAAYGTAGSEMADVWNPFCEPTFNPRTRLPLALNASHTPNIYLGATTYAVNSPVEGALVSLYFDGQTLATAIVTNGVAAFQFPALNNVGDIMVTGTQFNYIPYQGSVAVVPASGPYVVSQSIAIQEIVGNSNQKVDYGEKIALDIVLKNVGLEPAMATMITLSSSDTNINITDQSEMVGVIVDSTSVTLPAAFSFDVNAVVPDQHTVLFTLEIEYNNGQVLNVPFVVELNAPVLKATTYTLVESANSDNDGRFESGETLLLTVKNFNNGHANSLSATATVVANAPWLTISPAQALGVLTADGGTANAVFYLEIGAGAPSASEFDLQYEISASGYSASLTVAGVNVNPIVENFESQNFTNYPWLMSGTKPWAITSTNPYSGTSCARSGLIVHNQTSKMALNLNILQDGEVSFALRTGCEEDYDFLRFYVDGVKMGEWTGIKPWSVVAFPITAGFHNLMWTYEKDQFGTVQPDRVYVDEINLPPNEAVIVGTNNNPEQLGFEGTISPNPMSTITWLNLNLVRSSEIMVEVQDYTGKQMYSNALGVLGQGLNQVQLPLGHLPAGGYIVLVRGSEGVATYQLVKVAGK